ncbi:MAG: lipopolysaccharide biosynthesis protein [Sandaracinaceae bacterium]
MSASDTGRKLIQSVMTLMTGTLLAQVISVGVTPLLSRIYGPGDFGVIGLVNGAATVVVAFAALRYDMAVVLPKREADAANLVLLGLGSVGGATIASLLAVAFFSTPIARLMGSPQFGAWLWAAPAIVLVTGIYGVLTNWTTRQKKFRRLSISAVIASGSSAGAKISAGVAGLGVVGLVFGQLLGQLVAALALAAQVWRDDRRTFTRAASLRACRRLAGEYVEFPKFHAPMSLAFTLSYNMPLYVVGAYFGDRDVGYWSLTVLVLSTPVYLVGNAVRQVLFQRISSLLNEGQPVAPLLAKSTGALLAITLPLAILGWFLAPWGFGFLLGEEWVPAGEHARNLIAWQASLLVSMPSSAAFPALKLQRVTLAWQLTAIALGALALMWGGASGVALEASLAYGLTMTLMNGLLIGVVWLYARKGRRDAPTTSGHASHNPKPDPGSP